MIQQGFFLCIRWPQNVTLTRWAMESYSNFHLHNTFQCNTVVHDQKIKQTNKPHHPNSAFILLSRLWYFLGWLHGLWNKPPPIVQKCTQKWSRRSHRHLRQEEKLPSLKQTKTCSGTELKVFLGIVLIVSVISLYKGIFFVSVIEFVSKFSLLFAVKTKQDSGDLKDEDNLVEMGKKMY